MILRILAVIVGAAFIVWVMAMLSPFIRAIIDMF